MDERGDPWHSPFARLTSADRQAMRTFETTVNRAAFGILVTRNDDQGVRDPRIACVPLSSVMLLR